MPPLSSTTGWAGTRKRCPRPRRPVSSTTWASTVDPAGTGRGRSARRRAGRRGGCGAPVGGERRREWNRLGAGCAGRRPGAAGRRRRSRCAVQGVRRTAWPDPDRGSVGANPPALRGMAASPEAAHQRAEHLNTAYEMFTKMGADAFAERARRELTATGEKVRKQPLASGDELTAQEAQIAQLARGWADESGDRCAVVHQHAHGRMAPAQGLRQARGPVASAAAHGVVEKLVRRWWRLGLEGWVPPPVGAFAGGAASTVGRRVGVVGGRARDPLLSGVPSVVGDDEVVGGSGEGDAAVVVQPVVIRAHQHEVVAVRWGRRFPSARGGGRAGRGWPRSRGPRSSGRGVPARGAAGG